MIEQMGLRMIVYPDMKDKKPVALARIFQGQIAQPPMMAQRICPRRMLMYYIENLSPASVSYNESFKEV